MTKDRNTFYQSAGMTSQTVMPNIPMPNMQQPFMYNQMPAPVQASQASQSFYSGPDPQLLNQTTNNYYDNDLDNQIKHLELAINQLEGRISKLEKSCNVADNNYSSKMYMV